MNTFSPSFRMYCSSDELRADDLADRMGELMHRFPFYSEAKARAIAETELELIDTMFDDGAEPGDFS